MGEKAVLSLIVACVNDIFAPGLLTPPLPGSRAGVGLRERTEPFNCLLYGAFPVNLLEMFVTCMVLIRITVSSPLFNHFASCFLLLFSTLFLFNLITVSSCGCNANIGGGTAITDQPVISVTILP